MDTVHQFCGLHKLGYNSDYDPTCPQCTMAHISGAQQYDFDVRTQKPLDAAGNLLSRRTLKAEAQGAGIPAQPGIA